MTCCKKNTAVECIHSFLSGCATTANTLGRPDLSLFALPYEPVRKAHCRHFHKGVRGILHLAVSPQRLLQDCSKVLMPLLCVERVLHISYSLSQTCNSVLQLLQPRYLLA